MAASDDEAEQLTNGGPLDDGPDDADFEEANVLDAASEEADGLPDEDDAETEDEEVRPPADPTHRIFSSCSDLSQHNQQTYC